MRAWEGREGEARGRRGKVEWTMGRGGEGGLSYGGEGRAGGVTERRGEGWWSYGERRGGRMELKGRRVKLEGGWREYFSKEEVEERGFWRMLWKEVGWLRFISDQTTCWCVGC